MFYKTLLPWLLNFININHNEPQYVLHDLSARTGYCEKVLTCVEQDMTLNMRLWVVIYIIYV